MNATNTNTSNPISIEDGQFDDAPEDGLQIDPRNGHNFIDDDGLLEWSSESEPDEFEREEDELEVEAFDVLRAEDEDWEIAERDFTKQYNRVRQHVALRTGEAQGTGTALNPKTAVAPLPAVNRPRPVKTSQQKQQIKDKTENQLQALSKYSSRLRNIDMPYDLGVGINRKGPSATANMKDKSDRATSEQVLDPRTRIILFKMIGRGLIHEVNGCVSTGKEANVYHALTPEHKHIALKIYKTSILVFKDRDRYVTGEYRFRRGYSRHNPRKMVRLWAEKEMRNLKRLRAVGINCPEAVEVRENVLVMTFVGDKDGWASPRLKDAEIPEPTLPDLYVELMLMVRKMYTECKLVHADLSEYNILYHMGDPQPAPTSTEPASEGSLPIGSGAEAASTSETDTASNVPRGHLYIIDVSQSVEHDHPHAFDFLRSDLRNVEDFFSRRGVRTAGLRRAFEFVTREQLPENDVKPCAVTLREWMDAPEPEGLEGSAHPSGEQLNEDEVFMRSYIPRTLNEVYDPERDVGVLARGGGEKLIYADTIGIVGLDGSKDDGLENVQKKGVVFAADTKEDTDAPDEDGEDDDDEGDDASEEEEDATFNDKQPRGHRHEDKDAKKERKKAAKADAREKRKHKMPKAEKKRKIKTSARSG